MKKQIIIWFLLSLMLLTVVLTYKHVGSVKLVAMPPQSLEQWYKPENKRHVWLHNMFKLRREMQAVGYYAEKKQPEELDLWMVRLSQHYEKIAEMVPEWGERLDRDVMHRLVEHQKSHNFAGIPPLLAELKTSCDSCHERYRAVTALLYRAPNFETLSLDPAVPLTDSMVELQQLVNEIKIATEADDRERSLSAFGDLKEGVKDLGRLCVNCHEHLPKEYPNTVISSALADLEKNLKTGDKKTQGKALGMLAVTACAECHGTHRIAADTRKLLDEDLSWSELLKH